MKRRLARMIALILLLAACGTGGDAADDGDTATSTTTTSTSTTPTTVETTTTTESDPCEGEPFSMDERGLRLVEGCEYLTTQFALPIRIAAPSNAWLSFAEPNTRAVYMGIDENGDGSVEANIAFLAFVAGTDEEPFSEVLGIDGVASLSDPMASMVGGRSALTIDVLAVEEPTFAGFSGCTTTGVRIIGGYELVLASSNEGQEYGIPACVTTRVWQVTIDDIPITIVAAALDDDRFAEFMPIFEDFLENSVTFGDADG